MTSSCLPNTNLTYKDFLEAYCMSRSMFEDMNKGMFIDIDETIPHKLQSLQDSDSITAALQGMGVSHIRVMRKIQVTPVNALKKVFDFIPMERCSVCMTHGPMNTLRKMLDLIIEKAQELDGDGLKRTYEIIARLRKQGIDSVGLSTEDNSKRL
jgi:NADH:ubiquinone oxidoreductase subunit F (NADH-binding)